MQKISWNALAITFLLSPSIALAQSGKPPTSATHIAKGEVEAVLKHTGPEGAGGDRQIKVVDLGKYNVGVGVLHRGPTKPGAPVTGIGHSQVTEVYYVISGSGTLITGGTVVNTKPLAPDAEVVRVAVGPSFSGTFQGGDRRVISAGDVVIIPPGVLHGFIDIKDHVTYLSVRPDADHVLPAGYVHPAIRK